MGETCFVGIDFGTARIGVAVSDTEKKVAFPLDVVHRKNGSYGLKRLRKLLEDRNIGAFVVGLPYRENGEIGEEGTRVLQYCESLREYFNVDVKTWDERYTTLAAERMLVSSDVKRAGRKRVIDSISAQIILQSYLDALQKD
jgi:putative Holliday junction resolvase